MAGAPQAPEFWIDGIGELSGGMNAGVVPKLISPDQVARATNMTFRGGYGTDRPPIRKMLIDYGGDSVLQARIQTGLWQGACYYKSDYGITSLIASISGRLFQFTPQPNGIVTVREITILNSDGTYDTNPSGNSIAWLWQSEAWVIVNDGQSLPIFFDGNVSRRSLGPSKSLGTLAANFTVPVIGGSLDISLSTPYTGPVNTVIGIGSAYYQVNSSSSGYKVTVKNLGEVTGASVPVGSQLIVSNNFIGTTAVSYNPVVMGGGAITVCTVTGGVTTCHSYLTGTLHYNYGFPTVGFNPNGIQLDNRSSVPWPNSFSPIAVRTTGTSYAIGTAIFNPLTAAGIQEYFFTQTSLGTLPAGTPLYAGFFDVAGIAGVLQSGFTAPAVGNTIDITITQPYIGQIGQIVSINGGIYQIIAANNVAVPSTTINVTNINDTAGNTETAGTAVYTLPELPVGKMGAYGLGRNWMCLADGRSFIGSDIVGGSSGSPALASRDAVLKITENTFLFGGGAFVVPGNIGSIRAMIFTATLDQSLGQGPLQVFTDTTVFSCMAPVDRTTWATVTNPILTESLKGKGALGHYSTVLQNSDTIFRSPDGISSLILARRDFDTWGNVPISREVQIIMDSDDATLIQNSSAIVFDNRMLMTVIPTASQKGIFFQGLVALNTDPISSLRGKAASIYDGLWTGMQILQLVGGSFNGVDRAFAFTFDTGSNEIALYEIHRTPPEGSSDHFDNGNTPIMWAMESASLFRSIKGKGQFDFAVLEDGEISISDIIGVVNVQTWYRPDSDPCWYTWHSFSICADNQPSGNPRQYRPSLGLGKPDAAKCDVTVDKPSNMGMTFDFRIQITGHCKFMGARFKASKAPTPAFAKQVCDELCITP